MPGIENAYTLGKKFVIKTLEDFRKTGQEIAPAYFHHLNRLPYEIGPNSICPFCTDMIMRKINEGNKSGSPFNEADHPFKLGQFKLSVTTRLSIDTIEHFVSEIE